MHKYCVHRYQGHHMSVQTKLRCEVSQKRWTSKIGIACVILMVALEVSCGCLDSSGSPKYNLTEEDRAFLNATDSLPKGNWAASSMAEFGSDYQNMYTIEEEEMKLYDTRIQVLSSMPVSEEFQEIKEEIIMSDEYGRTVCEYEMKRTMALIEDNLTAEEELWQIENNAMDDSLAHMFEADRLLKEKYGI